MYALIVTVEIDPSATGRARDELQSRVVPAVRQAPGATAGYWLAPKEGGSKLEGNSWILFDSESNAKAAEQMAKSSPVPEGVAFTGFEIREVVASF